MKRALRFFWAALAVCFAGTPSASAGRRLVFRSGGKVVDSATVVQKANKAYITVYPSNKGKENTLTLLSGQIGGQQTKINSLVEIGKPWFHGELLGVNESAGILNLISRDLGLKKGFSGEVSAKEIKALEINGHTYELSFEWVNNP